MFGALVSRAAPVASGSPSSDGPADILRDVAADFSPRFERRGEAVVLDLAGLDRLFGHPRAIADALRTAIVDRGLRAHVAIAGTCTAAHLLAAHHSRPVTVVERGEDAPARPHSPVGDPHLLLSGFRRIGGARHFPALDVGELLARFAGA